jgi:hypothetical protein
VGGLGEGVYLTRDLEKAKAYARWAAKQWKAKWEAKKGVVVKVKVHLGKGVTADSQHHPMRTV